MRSRDRQSCLACSDGGGGIVPAGPPPAPVGARIGCGGGLCCWVCGKPGGMPGGRVKIFAASGGWLLSPSRDCAAAAGPCCGAVCCAGGFGSIAEMSKMSPTSSRTDLLVFAPLKSTTRLKQTKGPEEEQAGSSLFFVADWPFLIFVLSGAGLPHSSFLTSLHRVSLKVSCVSLPPVTSPTSVLTSSLHCFVCPACNRGYPEPARIGSSAGSALCPELTCAC